MSDISVNLSIPQGDIEAMRRTFDRYVEWFSKGPREAIKKTAVYIVRSLRASTKRSKDKRRVVRNPSRYNATKSQSNRFGRAHAHIQAWYEANSPATRTGRKQAWLPPLRQLVERRKSDYYAIERYTQRRGIKYIGIPDAFKDKGIAGAKATAEARMPKALKIMRRGTARSSWGWMLARLGKPATVEQNPLGGVVDVQQTIGKESASIDLINSLSYIKRATKENVNSAVSRARRAMIDEMEGHVKRVRQQAGMRAA